ncbi:hypothetical protein LCGC14_1535800, partial [marine sediment metagenome]
DWANPGKQTTPKASGSSDAGSNSGGGDYVHELGRGQAEFTGVFLDYGTDADGDGFYDYLTVEAQLDVAVAGDLTVIGGLEGTDHKLWATTETNLDVGVHTVELTFDGIDIRRYREDGPYATSFSVDGLFGLYAVSDTYYTSAYDYTEFESLAAEFSGVYQSYGEDSDGDVSYNHLTVDVDLDVATAGEYTVEGWLYDQAGEALYLATNFAFLPNGNQTISLSFDGMTIAKYRSDGPYDLKYLTLFDENADEIDFIYEAYQTPAYSYTEFQTGNGSFTGIPSDYGIDLDGNALFDLLRIETTVDVAEEGQYVAVGRLFDAGGEWISDATTGVALAAGEQTVALNFSGSDIALHEENGPYELRYTSLYDSDGSLADSLPAAYLTSAYQYTQFQGPAVTLTGNYTDFGTDISGDGDFDYLTVDVELVVENAGNYALNARLLDQAENEIIWASTSSSLEAGIPQTMQLNFSGSEIFANGVDGPYYLRDVYAYNTIDSTLSDSTYEAHTTAAYAFSDFGNFPPVADAGGPFDGTVGIPITFDASGSNDPDGQIVLYEWDWDANGTYDFSDTVPSAEHTWSRPFSDDVRLRVTDNQGMTSSDTAYVEVTSDSPFIMDFGLDTAVIDENDETTLSVDFHDRNPLDEHTAIIEWGDGNGDTLHFVDGERTFSLSHTYLDDDPTGTPSDEFVITATVSDDSAGDTATTTLTVKNVAPTLSDVLLTPEINEGESAILSGTISDPGTQDTFTLEVDWADGSPLETFTFGAGTTTFAVDHPYLDDDPSGSPSDDYTISFTLTDDDLGGAAKDPFVWAGATMTFTKADYADWTLPDGQDRITDNVWLTRQDTQGIFNIQTESYYNYEGANWDEITSPANTEWAYGLASDWESLAFANWGVWHDWIPPDTVEENAVLHLIEEDVYLDIKFLSWTENGEGGGFSYQRATEAVPGEKVWTGPTITFTKNDYADWVDPANQDRITQTTWITRRETKGLFNFKTELAYNYPLSSSPADTQWAFGSASDWQSLAFGPWEALVGGWNEGPPSILGKDLVLHLISDDIYLDFKFTSWTSGGNGGGFSYERSSESARILTSTLTVNNVAPTVVIDGMPESPTVATPIDLSSSLTDPGINDTFTYAWGVTKDGISYASGTSMDFSFIPDQPAVYVVNLEVTDDDSGVGTDSKTIEIVATEGAVIVGRYVFYNDSTFDGNSPEANA